MLPAWQKTGQKKEGTQTGLDYIRPWSFYLRRSINFPFSWNELYDPYNENKPTGTQMSHRLEPTSEGLEAPQSCTPSSLSSTFFLFTPCSYSMCTLPSLHTNSVKFPKSQEPPRTPSFLLFLFPLLRTQHLFSLPQISPPLWILLWISF